MKRLAKTANLAVMLLIVGIGASQWQEAQAQERVATISEENRYCLQQNVYFEARNQSELGQRAVAWVTLHRLDSARYPDNICGVVWQNRQFSWTHDGLSDNPGTNVIEQRAWAKAQEVVDSVLLEWASGEPSPVQGATMFHADYVRPFWADSYERVTQIDDHIFYQ